MKLLLLLGVVSSALHLVLALTVKQRPLIVARGMSATADCAGVSTVVCSVPERSSPESKTYRQFMKVQSIASQLSWPNGLLKPTYEEVLTFYALQQQGTIGDVDISRPWSIFSSALAKYNAWKEDEGVSCDEARSRYVRMFVKLLERARDQQESSGHGDLAKTLAMFMNKIVSI
ncbi:BZ3500_MvSof-1268-A1-R1_Chr4-4g07472 [Microbotryum saponariae]|uniref:BZ3500_MvSof-1268-A1-R1_Chr4-4g07472 protein n=1 Tax=Microbotryum saponariae TaxID=289078 RepID=A0A2X0KXI6_9BASI|nr:BZ3500_MvSof-1268-A1-R1_Chr4-4g07472 [Microbotryum saponariae]SDA07133.1 BZ3501_MvSof-1269-A2-R1_Chr4-3g07180 [Microbotryum saponariae]